MTRFDPKLSSFYGFKKQRRRLFPVCERKGQECNSGVSHTANKLLFLLNYYYKIKLLLLLLNYRRAHIDFSIFSAALALRAADVGYTSDTVPTLPTSVPSEPIPSSPTPLYFS